MYWQSLCFKSLLRANSPMNSEPSHLLFSGMGNFIPFVEPVSGNVFRGVHLVCSILLNTALDEQSNLGSRGQLIITTSPHNIAKRTPVLYHLPYWSLRSQLTLTPIFYI